LLDNVTAPRFRAALSRESLEVEETVIEDLDHLGQAGPVSVLDVTGQQVCFVVYEGVVL